MAGLNSTLVKSLIEQACWRNIGVWSQSSGRCDKLDKITHCRNCEVFAEAAKTVFKRESSEVELFEKSLDLYHAGDFEVKHNDISILPFRVFNTWLCVSPDSIVRIAKTVSIHHIPHREPQFIRGLVAVDGAIYTCVSIKHLLDASSDEDEYVDYASNQPGVFARIVIIQTNKKRLAIEVEEVRNVSQFNDAEKLEVSADCNENLRPFVTHEFCFDKFLNEPMYLLDIDAIEQEYFKDIL